MDLQIREAEERAAAAAQKVGMLRSFWEGPIWMLKS
jgi:hypothetical protein